MVGYPDKIKSLKEFKYYLTMNPPPPFMDLFHFVKIMKSNTDEEFLAIIKEVEEQRNKVKDIPPNLKETWR